MPKISIIVPVYNTEKYLARCIDSILAQTYTDFELILVNDGSTDNSGKICDEYAQKDSRIVVIHKKNGGVSSARNKGLDIAQGEWISFVDSDDEYYDNTSLSLIHSQISENIEYIIGGYVCCDEKGKIIYKIKENKSDILSSIDGIKIYYSPNFYSYLGYTCIKLYNRALITQNNLRFNEQITYNEDGLFHVHYCSVMKGKIKLFTQPFYKYYLLPTSAMGKLEQKFEKKFLTDFDAFILMHHIIKNLGNQHLIRLSKNAIINSYNRLHYMMNKFNSYNNEIHYQLKKQMLIEIGCYFYIKYKIWLLKCKFNTYIYKIYSLVKL